MLGQIICVCILLTIHSLSLFLKTFEKFKISTSVICLVLIVINNVDAPLYLTVFFLDRTTGGLASILKDSSEVKFSKEEQSLTCCILCTADYCLETTQQVRNTIQKHRYTVRAKGYRPCT